MTREQIWERAKKVAKDNEKVNHLLNEVKGRMEKVSDQKGWDGFLENLKVLYRMTKAYINGNRHVFSFQTLAIVVFGLLYFVTPADLIPDFVPALGFTDDIAIIYYLVNFLEKDITAFQEWELEQDSIN